MSTVTVVFPFYGILEGIGFLVEIFFHKIEHDVAPSALIYCSVAANKNATAPRA